MNRIVLGVEYEGTRYCGWQLQRHQPSVQQTLEQAIAKIAGKPVRIHACGRTDTGVHALNQVIHFDVEIYRPDDAWIRGVNSYLPKDIRVQWIKRANSEFHARYSALSRRYIYLVFQSKVSPGILSKGVTWCHYPLDLQAMSTAANYLKGEQDFSSFRAAGCQAKGPIRDLHEFKIYRQNQLIIFDVQANAFLHHMVRNMVGTLLCVGRGNMAPDEVRTLLEARNRQLAPQMAPAQGLYLLHASYPEVFELPNEVRYPWFLDSH